MHLHCIGPLSMDKEKKKWEYDPKTHMPNKLPTRVVYWSCSDGMALGSLIDSSLCEQTMCTTEWAWHSHWLHVGTIGNFDIIKVSHIKWNPLSWIHNRPIHRVQTPPPPPFWLQFFFFFFLGGGACLLVREVGHVRGYPYTVFGNWHNI